MAVIARRTRILATIGPASRDPATIRALIDAGADAFRLNFSHGTTDEHAAAYRAIREAASDARRGVAIVQDLAGPKIRTGTVASPVALEDGDELTIELGDFAGGPGRVACNFDALFTSVRVGQPLLLDDGKIELEVTGVAPGRLETRVENGGVLSSHKGINVPNTTLRTSALTPKDIEDLRTGIALGVDLVALSFIQSADDVRAARAVAASAGAPDLAFIAKIEKPHAVDHIEDILEVSDALMVARGDLGIEMPLESLPAVQKKLIRAARRRGVPAIVATQVLESMISETRPTRAEVTDAAHAVEEGADAIMLAAETASGKYPIRAVSTLDLIVREAEKMLEPDRQPPPDDGVWSEHARGLCQAAVTLADRAHASAIVAVTEAGKTARLLAALRPAATILAATPNAATAARLALVWGVTPLVTEDLSLDRLRATLTTEGLVSAGAVVVFVAIHPVLGRDDTNFLHVERL